MGGDGRRETRQGIKNDNRGSGNGERRLGKARLMQNRDRKYLKSVSGRTKDAPQVGLMVHDPPLPIVSNSS